MQTRPGDYIRPERRATCKRCNTGDLGWYQNKRGRWYLCNTAPSQDDSKRLQGVRYLAPWSPHRCEDVLAKRAERDEQEQRERDAEAQLPELRAICDALAEGDLHGAAVLEDAYRDRWGR